MSEVAIKLEGISKKYTIGKEKDGSLRGALSSLFSKSTSSSEDFWALKNVSFEVKKGDVVGIIGKNGAGKSTLLKILSQITRPTEGKIEINGRIASLLEVGTGFHPELTGRENIFLNGTILGMTRKEVQSKFDEIVAFSGIEKFIDTPVKHYSSGMYVRLAFAVAAHLEPEILIIDEVLAVGDAEFQKKCLGKMKDVAGEGRTVLFVSHQLSSIKQLCTNGVLLEKGKLTFKGKIDDVISQYQNTNSIKKIYSAVSMDKDVYVEYASIINGKSELYFHEKCAFLFQLKFNQKVSSETRMLVRLLNNDSYIIGSTEIAINNNQSQYELVFEKLNLTKGHYFLNCILYLPAITQYDNVDECCHFEVLDNNSDFAHLETFNIGSVYLQNSWSIK